MKAIDLAKRVYENFGNGDLPGVLACLSSDIEWQLLGPSQIPYVGTYRGLEGVQRFFASLLETEEILEFAPEHFIDGGNTVVVLGHERCRTRATGKEYSVRWVQVFDAMDGAITRWQEYLDTAAIVEAHQK